MTLGNKIANYRKNLGITQDALAQQLGVTNQAVSKWESDQCCPDVMLLPKIADIFGISLDELFGREMPRRELAAVEPAWPDDNVLRVAVYVGSRLVCGGRAEPGSEYAYNGDVAGVLSHVTVSCGDVQGDVYGDISVTGSLNCGNVEGDVDAGKTVNCGNVGGDVSAGSAVSCGNVGGDVDAGAHVGCGNVGGDVDAGTDVKCGDVGGDVDAGGKVECGGVEGDINAGGAVIIRK